MSVTMTPVRPPPTASIEQMDRWRTQPFTSVAARKAERSRRRSIRPCVHCGTPFPALTYGKYCGKRCKNADRDRRVPFPEQRPRTPRPWPRRREVLLRLARGQRPAEIAEAMGITYFGVRTAMEWIRDRLEAETTEHAVALALVRGVIRAEEVCDGDNR